MTRRWADGLRALASGLVSLALLAWLASQLRTQEVWALLSGVEPLFLAGAALLGPLQVALAAERWRLATDQFGGGLTRKRALKEVALSTLLNQVLPGGVAGDAVRAWRVRQGLGALSTALQTVVFDRWVGLLVHVAVTVTGVLFWLWAYPEVVVPTAVWPVLTGLLLALPAVLLLPRLGPLARRILRRGWLPQFVLSIALTATFLVGFLLCALALGQSLGGMVLAVVPLVLLAMALPVSIGGWGLREASAALLLPRFGWSEEAAVALSVTYGLSALLGASPGVLAVWWRT